MIPISRALKIIERETRALGSERTVIGQSVVGRVLREKIAADTDLPPFDRSQMDGFAVIAADTKKAPAELRIVGESAAGRGWHRTMKPGEAVRIMTGAPLPKGADAVQKVELTRETGDEYVHVLEPTATERFIVRRGSEIKKGNAIFASGDVVTDNMIAAMASFGYSTVRIGRQPLVAVLGTGSEIVDVTKKPGRDQIRNSNSLMLDVFCRRFGARPIGLPIVKDDISDLKLSIAAAAKGGADILLITGGVSVGKYDHTKTALAQLGAEIFFEKLKLKPGKPAVFARLGRMLVFALPGNPVSAAVTFYLFVRKAILKMQGASATDLRNGFAVLSADAKAARERDTYLPARLAGGKSGHLFAHPLKWQGSSDLIGFARADSLIVLPEGTHLAKGETARIVYL